MYWLIKFCPVGDLPLRAASGHLSSVRAFKKRVFEYLDYRRYLADYYAHHKKHEYGFSYRVMARRAGCRSTNYPCLIITGKRNLASDMAMRFAEACQLSGDDAAYFSDLVAFNQAKTQREREHWYGRLSRFAQFRRVHRLTESQARYFERWYIPATRELAARPDFKADPAWIAGLLEPSISEAEARSALKTLLELGFLRERADGSIDRPA